MIPEFFVLVSFFYHFGWVANLIIKRALFTELPNLSVLGDAKALQVIYHGRRKFKQDVQDKSH